jgi:endonuclease/exonuclease/phosphatase family metal-dependent hydrolase
MTWNIHGAYGRNPRFDLDRVIALIQGHKPDVIALQEIDSRRPRAAGIAEPFGALEAALGAHSVGAKTITTMDGEYGQALISRWPIRNIEIHDISYQEREPRRAICGQIAAPSSALRVIATHLGLSVGERRGQAQALLRLIGDAALPIIVLGDFNDWFWVGSVRKALSRELPGRTHFRTFPSICPLLRLDRIYCRPRGAFVDCYTDRSARAVSDHLPVIADVTLNGARRA